ncbi:hypothetical protein E4T42_02753, partial [Aureobasidium subglaciale]
PSNLPNLRRLFVEARTEAEESAYSRNARYSLSTSIGYFDRLYPLQGRVPEMPRGCVFLREAGDFIFRWPRSPKL